MFKVYYASFAFAFVLLSLVTSAQTSNDNTLAFVDRPGDLYMLKKNILYKYDTAGSLLYMERLPNIPTVFEPRDGARMFIFYRDTKQCAFFSDQTRQEFMIEDHYAIDPLLACSSGDYNIWVLDQADISLKKISPAQQKVLTEATINQHQFNSPPEFIGIREYQNFLFLHEKNTGILVFNSLGIQIKKIGDASVEYFNFLGEELYYKKESKLTFYDLFDSSSREEQLSSGCPFSLLTDSRTYQVCPTYLNVVRKR